MYSFFSVEKYLDELLLWVVAAIGITIVYLSRKIIFDSDFKHLKLDKMYYF